MTGGRVSGQAETRGKEGAGSGGNWGRSFGKSKCLSKSELKL